jgi:hypothetical protein
VVHGCWDYNEEKRLLERIDRILILSGVEQLFLSLSVERFEAKPPSSTSTNRGTAARAEALSLRR